MRKIVWSLMAVASLASAGGCVLVQSNEMNVTWKGYKTLAKLGVAGQFTGVTYTPNAKEGKNFKALLVGSKVSIDLSKIDTKNKGRDNTLVENFFSKLGRKSIEANIVSLKADEKENGKRVYHGMVDVNVTMNNKTLLIPMKYHYKEEKFSATGTIDLFDFQADGALKSLNKSCFVQHKGKTWNDVTIGFTTHIKATLCDVKIEEKKK